MEYEILRIIWWGLIGVLLIGFMIMDGHDMGVGILSPFVGKTNYERRAAINSVAPHWDGNQVWFITAGGAVFAAWPLVYAASFSMLYIAILAVLWTIFLRAPAFEYRSKINNPYWRTFWDWVLFTGSFGPALLFGVAFGNLLLGIPFHFNDDMQLVSDAKSPLLGFIHLLSPFALLCGLISLFIITTHGANYLALRTEGDMQKRAKKIGMITTLLTLLLYICAGFCIYYINGFIATNIDFNGPSNPLLKTVIVEQGAWLNNFRMHPILLLIPGATFIGLVCSIKANKSNQHRVAFIASSIALAGIILTAAVSMFPFVLPSSSSPNSGLTLWDSTSSQHTLQLMLIAVCIFMPLILLYTSWVYKIMNGKLTAAKIKENSQSFY